MSAHVSTELDQPRQLLFNLKAVKALEQKVGDVGLITVLQRLKDMHLPTLERAVWAGLLHQEPALGLDTVVKRISAMDDAGKPIGQLFVDTINAITESHMFKMSPVEIGEGNAQPEPVAES